jgi:hypothetical protein
MTTTAGDALRAAAALFEQRQSVYRDNHDRLAGMLTTAFPDGVVLETSEDHARFALFCLIMVKLSRYAVQWEDGHADSINDAIVYLAMLGARDAANRDRREPGQRDCLRPVDSPTKPGTA